MTNPKNASSEPVTVVFSWTVKPGKEQLFEHMMHDVHKVARTFPGHMGVTTLRSPEHKGRFQTVLRFDNTQHLEAWLNSPIRQEMMEFVQEIAQTYRTNKATGMETWFEVPDELIIPPPKWKMAAVTFTAIYPLSLLFSEYLTPHILHWPVEIRALFLPIIAPIVLTYLFMPFLTQHVFKKWLYKPFRS